MRSLYVVSFRRPGSRKWHIDTAHPSKRGAFDRVKLLRGDWSPPSAFRIQRWVRPTSVGTHGWLWEGAK